MKTAQITHAMSTYENYIKKLGFVPKVQYLKKLDAIRISVYYKEGVFWKKIVWSPDANVSTHLMCSMIEIYINELKGRQEEQTIAGEMKEEQR